jgi:hypothetical protein
VEKMKKMIIFVLFTSILLLINTSVVSLEHYENIPRQSGHDPNTDIIDMIQQVNENMIYDYLKDLTDFGPRYTGTENCTLAGQYIYNEFEKMDLDVEFHDWNYANFKSKNVVATQKGTDIESDAIYIFCAHYDTTRKSPGANDDGSGVAAMMTIANICSKYTFNHTIRFIAFSGEEVGTYGSFSYARDAYKRGDNIIAVLNADIIGYADTEVGGNIIRFSNMDRSSWISSYACEISEKYQDNAELTVENIPNYRGADNQAFVDYGYDGVWIVEHDGHQWTHSPEDTMDHINFTYLTKVTKLLLATFAELANKPIDVQVILKTPHEARGYIFNRSLISLDLGKYYFKGYRGITVILGRANATCEVRSHEEIKSVVFCINNDFMYWDSKPPYEWKIEGKFSPLIGRYKLRVYAYTTSGKRAVDEMDIIILTLSYQYKK